MNKKQNKNKRAFTLTELLIVVIVIGVLSAVTLPKFNRVIENRKVTEAEEMMSAVRTEQERRCAMDKNYTLKFDNLADVISSSDTKNYKYSLQAEGISAKSNKGNYTLKMLSYQDGSFCCTGDDCAKLNKNYPSCDGLTFPSSGCGGTDGTVEITPDPTPTPEPTPTPAPSCEGSQPADKVKDCACGTVKASYSCSAATNYKWVLGEFPDCPAKPANITETCSDGTTKRTKSYACVNGAWTLGNWDKECPTCDNSNAQFCEDPLLENAKPGTWNYSTCTCTCPAGTKLIDDMCVGACKPKDVFLPAKCEAPQSKSSTPGKWNQYTCECECPAGMKVNSEGECRIAGQEDKKGVWVQDGVEVVRGFLCDEPEANDGCRGYSTSAPSGECEIGAEFFGGCSVNDYCPGHGIDVEVIRWVCE